MSNPIGIFLLGGPGSGKDYVLKNIFSRFDLMEVQADQIINGNARKILESSQNLAINGVSDLNKINQVKKILEQKNYTYDFVHVEVTNKVSRIRNEQRDIPLSESKRIDKFLKAKKLAESTEAFVFNNSINLNESSEMEKIFFASEIEKLLENLISLGLEMGENSTHKVLTNEQTGLTNSTLNKTYGQRNAIKRSRHRQLHHYNREMHAAAVSEEVWDEPNPKKNSKPLSAAQKAKAKARADRAGRKYPNLVDNMWASQNEQIEANLKPQHSVESIASKHKVSIAVILQALSIGKEVEKEHTKDDSVAEIIALAHLWENPDYYTQLAKVEKGSGALNERQLIGTDSYRKHAISMTPGQDDDIEEPLADCCGGKSYVPFKEFVENQTATTKPVLNKKRAGGASKTPGPTARITMDGLPITAKEAVEYHFENNIALTENVFRPGSEMFFEMISEAKRLYAEGAYEPKDEWERDMLESNIGEKAMFEGQEVILDYPFEEMINEDDPTKGKGIGKPWREGGGGAVYVRDGGSIRKISFSKSGMKKKYMDPAATRSFVARHHCLTNKDKTSASYWACRWPRFFSNSGKTWW